MIKRAKWLNVYLALSLLTTLVCIALVTKPPLIIELLESKTLDLRFIARGARSPGSEVVIVAIDEKSLAQLGRWPWSRTTIGDLIKTINQAQPAIIGADILFTEPQTSAEQRLLENIIYAYGNSSVQEERFTQHLQQQYHHVDADAYLTEVILASDKVILPFALEEEKREWKEFPEDLYAYSFFIVHMRDYYDPIDMQGGIAPLPAYMDSALSLGHVYTRYDDDGIIRSELLYPRYGDWLFPSFGLEIVRNYLELPQDAVELIAGDGITLGETFYLTDSRGRILLNFPGPMGTFKHISAVDILQGKVDPVLLKDKIVLIGTTALGAFDIHVTPYANMPGVEKQAAVIENLLHQNYLYRDEKTLSGEIVWLLVTGLVLGLILTKTSRYYGIATATGLMFIYIGIAYLFFTHFHIWISLVVPLFQIAFMFSAITAVRFFTEEHLVKEIKHLFSNYVAETVVEELISDPSKARLGGHRAEVTVLFSDIRSFTTYSESRSPEEIVEALNEYLTAMTEVIFHWNGTLDKFVGDEIMAFWGAPLEQPDHAERAARCALHMMARLKELQDKWVAEGKQPLDIGIGLNTGDVLVGNIGAEGKKMDYTIIGDHVNLGARVEALTRNYHNHIMLTEFTVEKIKHLIADKNTPKREDRGQGHLIGKVKLSKTEAVKVKGKHQPVMMYELVNMKLPLRRPD
ncbi:CHASE2 domain-containing protein [Pseudomonadota bacterium]